jgi:Flp pilus assembly protein TadB
VTYLVPLVLGLGIGAVFLVVLLIGDRKEARREAQKKAVQEQIAQAGQPAGGGWPPPSVLALPGASAVPASPANPAATRAANRKMVRNFFLVRNYAAGTLVLAYIVCSCFPHLDSVWGLLTAAGAVLAVWGVLRLWKRRIRN